MRSAALGDVFKVWLYAMASILLGAWLAPILYNMGKALAEVSSVKQINGPIEWLADHARSADFPQFFVASVGLAAVLLALPFAGWVRAERSGSDTDRPWQIRIPMASRGEISGQPLMKNPHAMRHLTSGFCVGASLFAVICGLMLLSKFFQLSHPPGGQLRAIFGIMLGAIVSGAVQEVVFRGVILGIFLRAMRPALAIGFSALLFALFHFLYPGGGLNVPDPDAAGVGFELVGLLLSQFYNFKVVVGVFAPLVALGAVLAFARWRTASLWLPIGLHVGWIFVTELSNHFTARSAPLDVAMEFLFGNSLQQGLCAVFGILAAGLLINFLTVRFPHVQESATEI